MISRVMERFSGSIEAMSGSRQILLDENGTVVSWNKGVEMLKGYSDNEIIGQHISIFYLPDDRQAGLPQLLLNEARYNGKATHEGRRIRKNGTIFPGCIEITAIKDEGGELIGFSKLTRHKNEENDSWHFSFDKDGILHVSLKNLPTKTNQVTQFRNQIFSSFYSLQSVCSICDFRNIVVTDETIVLYKPGVSNYYKAIAYISDQQFDFIRERLNAFLPHEIPIAVFPCPLAAKNWIAQFA